MSCLLSSSRDINNHYFLSCVKGLRLRSHRRRRPHREDQARLEPEQGVQAGIQALEGGPGEPEEAHHQVARAAGHQMI